MVSFLILAVVLTTAFCQIVVSPLDPANDIVNPTNVIRAQYCLPPIVWDQALAELADVWARQCHFANSPQGIRDLTYFDTLSELGEPIPNPLTTGENIAAACISFHSSFLSLTR
jgi:uncharacterized protein YkwD